MHGATTTAVPAGWYADPTGEPQLRWWDGENWSEHTFTPEASAEVRAHDDAMSIENDAQTPTEADAEPQLAIDAADEPMTRRGRRAAAGPVDSRPAELDVLDNAPAEVVQAVVEEVIPVVEPVVEEAVTVDAEFATDAPDVIPEATIDTQTAGISHFVDDEYDAEPLTFLPTFVESTLDAGATELDAATDTIASATEAESESASAGFLKFITGSVTTEPAVVFDQSMQTTATGPMQRESIMYTGIEGTREDVKARSTRLGRARAHTASVWFLAIMPLLQTAMAYGVVTILPQSDNFRIILGALIVPWVWSIALAVRDRKRLVQSGHDTTAHWAWAALSPLIYLVVRTIRVHRLARRGSGPLWVWLMSTAGQVAAGVLMAGAVAGILTSLFSVEVAKNVESSIARQGAMVAVECPTDAPLTPGSEFQCAATHDTGRSYAVNVRVADLLGGFTWQLTDDATAIASAK